MDGRRDLLLSRDVENPLGLSPTLTAIRTDADVLGTVETDAELCLVRCEGDRGPQRVALCRGSYLRLGAVELRLPLRVEYCEVERDASGWKVLVGDPAWVAGQ